MPISAMSIRVSRFALLLLGIASPTLQAAESGVILLYHHVSDLTPAITSVSPNQFIEHLEYLEENQFSVMSLGEILYAVSEKQALPERAVAISFDDAYESVYEVAYPQLKQRGWPFSVFVASEAIDQGYGGFMSWDQLREVQQYGAEIGGHSVSHTHLVRRREREADGQWLLRVAEEIDEGNRRIEEELDQSVRLFAYPYGESNIEIRELLEERSIYGLAQQSGAVGYLTDLYQVPRYPLAQGFSGMERFALVARSKALPVTESRAGALVRVAGEVSGTLDLMLEQGDYQLNNFACYSSRGEPLHIEREGLHLRIDLPDFVAGRNKINCTAPSVSENGIYYWYSQQWLVQEVDGSWPEE